jgi:hypothetical protein
MGFFSFMNEKGKSIPNKFSNRKTSTIYMVAPNGDHWAENNYAGYGVFGGKDYYQLLAELNGLETRNQGLELAFDKTAKDVVRPRFCETLVPYDQLPDPVPCPYQGFFYL